MKEQKQWLPAVITSVTSSTISFSSDYGQVCTTCTVIRSLLPQSACVLYITELLTLYMALTQAGCLLGKGYLYAQHAVLLSLLLNLSWEDATAMELVSCRMSVGLSLIASLSLFEGLSLVDCSLL